MKCKLTRPMPSGIDLGQTLPAGHLIDHPDAWRLVQMGVAEPADPACVQRAGMTPERTAAALKAFERVAKGIAPEDYDAFDSGEMTGYHADGSWIAGPNAPEPEPSEFEQALLS